MVQIVDDAIPEQLFQLLEDNVKYMNWGYHPFTARQNDNFPSFSSLAFCKYDNISSPIGLITECAFRTFCPDNIGEILRIRYGMFMKGDDHIHDAHVDFEDLHKTCLIYINDSDGDTYLYNETHDPFSEVHSEIAVKAKELTISKRITPKRNRAVIFDGLQFHSSSMPTQHPSRIAVNINYTLK